MTKSVLKAVLTLLLFLSFSDNVFAQTISLNHESELYEFKEKNSSKHFSYILYPLTDDSLFNYNSKPAKRILKKNNFEFNILNPETAIRYNSNSPFGWNDGVMIPNKGLQTKISTGIFLKKSFLSAQIKPELLFVQNQQFETFPENYAENLWYVRYSFYNQIDNPERFTKIKKLYPGQSYLKMNYKKISAGISSENRWWGPGRYNNLLLTNNAPGYIHFFLQTERPINTKVGKFEFQLIAGDILASDEFPPDTGRTTINNVRLYRPKPTDDKRYLNGFVFVYQPSFIKGLSAGLGRVFYLYKSDRSKTFDGYLPVFGSVFKNGTTNEDEKKRDQMLSLYLKQTFDKGNSDIYIEYGRNDHAWNIRDFITDPFHSRAYVAGINKFYKLPKRKLNINIEVSELSRSSKANPRPTPYWYSHHQVLHGYTNYGQVLGAGIGTGSAMQSVTADFIKSPTNNFGFFVYRIERNKDFFYDAFLSSNEYYRKWVDLVLGCKMNKSFKHFNLYSNINLIRSYNYQWQDNSSSWRRTLKDGIDILNLSANISIQYKL